MIEMLQNAVVSIMTNAAAGQLNGTNIVSSTMIRTKIAYNLLALAFCHIDDHNDKH